MTTNFARQVQVINAKKRLNGGHAKPKGADPLVEARAQVRALELKCRSKDDEIARLNRELAKRR
jgi:hypothetical protein